MRYGWGLKSRRDQRKAGHEGRAQTLSGTFRVHASAMKLYQVPHDCQTKSQTSKTACCRTVSLAKTIKDIWQEILTDSLPRVSDGELRMSVRIIEPHLYAPTFWCEFHGI